MRAHNKSGLLHKRLLLISMLLTSLVISGCQLGVSSSYTATKNSGFGKQSENVAAIRTDLAAQYIKTNKLDAAMQQLQHALQADTKYTPAYDMMGVLLQTEGSVRNLQKADSYFIKALELDNNFVRARNNYGVYLYKMARYAEAAEQLNIAATTLGYNGRISALENLGRTHLQLGNTEQAKQSFLKVLANDDTSLIAHTELVDILIAENRLVQAQNFYNRLLGLVASKPLSASILRQGIILATKHNDIETQKALSQQLLAQYPTSEEAKNLNIWLNNPEAPWK